MAKKKILQTLTLDEVHVDDEFQSRDGGIDEEHVEQIVESLKKKPGSIPRVKIVEVKGIGRILVDGFGRYEAHKRAGLKNIQADVTVGSMLDATIAAAQANADQVARHRTNADKRRAVQMLLMRLLDAGEEWSDRKVGDTIGVSDKTVASVRENELRNFRTSNSEKNEDIPLDDGHAPEPKRKGSDGKLHPAKKPPKSSTDGDSWQSTPLAEFLNADPYIMEALDTLRITTAGDLDSRIAAGETLGLQAIDIKDIGKQLAKLKGGSKEELPPPAEKKKEQGQIKGFNFSEFKSAFGIVMRGLDEFGRIHKDENSAEKKECLKGMTHVHKHWGLWTKRLAPQESE